MKNKLNYRNQRGKTNREVLLNKLKDEITTKKSKSLFILKKKRTLNSLKNKLNKIKRFLRNPTLDDLVVKNKIKQRLSLFVFQERYVKVLEQILGSQTEGFSVFLDKIRVAEAHLKDLRGFYFKEQKTFSAFLKRKKHTESRSISLLFKLVKIINVVDVLCLELQKKFSTKFVGMKAFRLVQKFLDNYCYLYEYWLEFERAGIFDQMISFKNKVKLMRSFWYPRKARRFLREPIWKSVCPDRNFVTDFKKVKRLGFSMSELKLTDELFFWHAFTRKKINQNMWFIRSKKMFRKLSVLRQNKLLNKKITGKMFSTAKHFFMVLNFFKVIKKNFFSVLILDNLKIRLFFSFLKKRVKMLNFLFTKCNNFLNFINKITTNFVCFFQKKQKYSLFNFLDIKINCSLNLFFLYLAFFNFKGFFSLFVNGFFVSKNLPVFFFFKNSLLNTCGFVEKKIKKTDTFFIFFDAFHCNLSIAAKEVVGLYNNNQGVCLKKTFNKKNNAIY